jgi:CelD/BcsL family acetyltransferase involved in cellulose biosynthesis
MPESSPAAPARPGLPGPPDYARYQNARAMLVKMQSVLQPQAERLRALKNAGHVQEAAQLEAAFQAYFARFQQGAAYVKKFEEQMRRQGALHLCVHRAAS